jgi:hypothetical protein
MLMFVLALVVYNSSLWESGAWETTKSPKDTIEELGWNINDDVNVIIAEEHYGEYNQFTHNTITIERVEDYNKYIEEEE